MDRRDAPIERCRRIPTPATSLVWGGTVSDVISTVAADRKQLASELRRPIAVVANWRREIHRPKPDRIFNIQQELSTRSILYRYVDIVRSPDSRWPKELSRGESTGQFQNQ